MSQNLYSPGSNSTLQQSINTAVATGNTSNVRHPDAGAVQYLKAAIAAGTYAVPGCPSLELAEAVKAAIGA
jgi:hypothetical protein